MKEKVILILNKKIKEMKDKKSEAEKNFDLRRTGNYQRIIEILSELMQEIQDTL